MTIFSRLLRTSCTAVLLLLLGLQGEAAAEAAGKPPVDPLVSTPTDSGSFDDTLTQIDTIVRAHSYRKGNLASLGWDNSLREVRGHHASGLNTQERADAFNRLLSTLGTSHTAYVPRSDPAYWQLASIFEPVITRECTAPTLPPLPVTTEDIGVFWKHIESRWYVGGLYAHGAAEMAGLHTGDEIIAADGKSFSPVAAFEGKSGKEVSLQVRRLAGGSARSIQVVPQSFKPHEALLQATTNSWHIIDHGTHHYAYVRVWAWTSTAIQQAVLQAITRSNQTKVNGFILDLRDGWGGASPGYLSIFDRDIPILESMEDDGTSATYDAQIRQPTAILINGGTRSGKEIIAYGAKAHHFARLVGERTAGAVVFGEPFCLPDGALLYLAVNDALVDGKHLEGSGVTPDREVPFDIRHSDGKDPQLDAALQTLDELIA